MNGVECRLPSCTIGVFLSNPQVKAGLLLLGAVMIRLA